MVPHHRYRAGSRVTQPAEHGHRGGRHGRGASGSLKLRPAILLVAGVLIGIAPVAVRNVVVADQWSLVSSHGGLNFYMGNSETATGFYNQIPGITPDIKG